MDEKKEFIIISSSVTETFTDWPDDESSAIIIYFTGCNNNCPGCQNANTVANVGKIKELENKEPNSFMLSNDYLYCISNNINVDNVKYIKFEVNSHCVCDFCKFTDHLIVKFNTNKIILQGGDPLCEGNNINFIKLYNHYLNGKDYFKNKHINTELCIYTGSSISSVIENGIYVNYIKCGKFDKNLYQEPGKTKDCLTLASKNQEFYKCECECGYNKISENGKLYFNIGE